MHGKNILECKPLNCGYMMRILKKVNILCLDSENTESVRIQSPEPRLLDKLNKFHSR